ncbi:MAG: FkbM family methyltransferase [Planctomycetota bacterium]
MPSGPVLDQAPDAIAALLAEPLAVADVGADGGLHRRWHPFNHLTVLAFDARDDAQLGDDSHHPGASILGSHAVLDAEPRDRTLHITAKPNCSSLYEPNPRIISRFADPERLRVVERIGVRTSTLAAEAQRLAVDRVDFMKVDVQGAELDVLRGASPLLASAGEASGRVIGAEVEVQYLEMYAGAPGFADVARFMLERGYELIDLRRVYAHPTGAAKRPDRKGQLLFGDALFMLSPALVDSRETARRACAIALAYELTSLAVCYAEIRQGDPTLDTIARLGRAQLARRPDGPRVNDQALGNTPGAA